MAVSPQHLTRTGILLNNRAMTPMSNEDVSMSLQTGQTLNLAFGLPQC